MSSLRDRLNLGHPAQILVGAFLGVDLLGAVLLRIPAATESGEGAGFLDALFTSTSAICVTGLTVVDTGTYWSAFGQVVILVLMALGGLGMTTSASLFAVLVSRKLGLRSRLLAQTETGANLGSVRQLLKRIVVVFVLAETLGWIVLTLLFWQNSDRSLPASAWQGLFHAVSAFNNAGFSTNADSLTGYRGNPALLVAVSLLIVVGGIGYPVINDMLKHRKREQLWRNWNLHTKITLSTTAALIVGGTALILLLEWSNPGTLGGMDWGDKLANSYFGSVTPRTAGFNTIDYAQVKEPTLVFTEALMLIGGGSASAAGGIKVTTFALLGYVIWAELRGEPDVNVFDRRVSTAAQREALSVALLGVGAVVFGAFVLGAVTDYREGEILFEAVSALGTTGLSTGITPDLPEIGHLILIGLMLMGRLGPLTFGTAFVLRSRDRLYRYPEDRPLIG